MIINGADVTLYVIAFIIMAIFFFLQYILCCKTKKIIFRLFPSIGVLGLIIWAAAIYVFESDNSFFNIRGLLTLAIMFLAILCGISVGLGWIAFIIRKKVAKGKQK